MIILKTVLNLKPDQQAIIGRSVRGVYTVNIQTKTNQPYVELKIAPKDREYNIIHVTKETKGFFPGYKVQFVLDTDIKPFVMHLTGANNGTTIGDDEGGYLCHPRPSEINPSMLTRVPDADKRDGSFKQFYDAHPRLQGGDYVKIFRLTPDFYRLS